jgi:hypothetical protein
MQGVMQPGMNVRQRQRPRLPLLQHSSCREQLRHLAEALKSRQPSNLAPCLSDLHGQKKAATNGE